MTRSRALLLLGLVCSVIFLWLALRNMELTALGAALARLNLWWSIPFIFSLLAFCWSKSIRWSILLEPVAQARANQLFPAVLIGYAGTTLMPMQLGEIARTYVAARTLNASATAVLATIALERVLDVFVLLCVLGLVMTLGADIGSNLARAGLWLTALGILAFAMLATFAVWPSTFLKTAAMLVKPLPRRVSAFVLAQLAAGSTGLGILKRPSRFAALTLFSALQWSFMLGCCWVSLQALGGELPATAALLVLVTTLFGMSLPSGPGYVGTIQLAFWIALERFGVTREDAIAASLFYHALICGPLLLGGIYYLLRLGIGFGDLRSSGQLGKT